MKYRVLRGLMLGALAAVLAACLGGCMFEPVDKLYALPVLPQEYKDLQATIETTMNELGAEYAVINYGSNTSTIQLLDLEGDGEQETAAVFLRVASAEERPMRVCLFRQGSDNAYRQIHMLSGEGNSINSVVYEDLNGDGIREIIVSWQLSGGVHILTANNLAGSEADELMSTTYNETYIVTDLNEDGSQEIIIFQQDSTGEGNNRAELYQYQDGVMTMTAVAPMSDGLRDVAASEAGRLADGRLAVYVSVEVEMETGVLTDILTLEGGNLVNITRDVESGISLATGRSYTEVGAVDINNDGVLEIPRPRQLTPIDPENSSTQYLIYWQQFDSRGNSSTSCMTYHAVSDSWYLNLPNGWGTGNISVARDDSLSSRGERAVIFYYWPDKEEGEPEKFLTIYRLTGNNRKARSKLAGRITLFSDSTTTYCAVLNPDVWDCGMDQNELVQRFKPITVEWANAQRSAP